LRSRRVREEGREGEREGGRERVGGILLDDGSPLLWVQPKDVVMPIEIKKGKGGREGGREGGRKGGREGAERAVVLSDGLFGVVAFLLRFTYSQRNEERNVET